jgi:adenylate kinase family enzyme
MNPQTFIFIGRSGCGKGTQAALLEKALKNNNIDRPIVHLETGKFFRDFFKGATYTHEKSKKIYDTGGLQPEFLTVHLWSDFLVTYMKNDAHLIIDGTPRRRNEATVLHSAFQFYARTQPIIIHLNVSREWSEARMTERKREDDTSRDIQLRLDWFDAEVIPTIDYYRDNAFYKYVEVDGQKSVEEVHADIVKMAGLV